METGERHVLEQFPSQVDIRQWVKGLRGTQDRARDIDAARAAWEASKEMIEASRGCNPKYDMILLDELNIVMRYNYLPVAEVIENLRGSLKTASCNYGRNAKPELIEIADLVTEMTQIKHPFREQDVKAQKGIEY